MAKGVSFVQVSKFEWSLVVKVKNANRRGPSNEKVEKDQERAEDQERRRIDVAAARDASERAHHFGGNHFQTRLFAWAVERTNRPVAGEVPLVGSDFVVDPYVNVVAAAPHQHGAGHKGKVAEKS
jgi:hypothetical protein